MNDELAAMFSSSASVKRILRTAERRTFMTGAQIKGLVMEVQGGSHPILDAIPDEALLITVGELARALPYGSVGVDQYNEPGDYYDDVASAIFAALLDQTNA